MSVQQALPIATPSSPKVAPSAEPAVRAEPVKEPAAKPAVESKASPSLLGGAAEPEKTEGEQIAGGESKDGKPAAGELDIKLPEGFEPDAKQLEAFKGFAKEAGFSSEQASKLVAWNAERQAEALKADVSMADERSQEWRNEVLADKDFGGSEEKLRASSLLAQKALRRFGDAEFAKFLLDVKLENHPGLFKMLARIGRATAEDKADIGGAKPPAQQSQEDVLRAQYPNSPALVPAKP